MKKLIILFFVMFAAIAAGGMLHSCTEDSDCSIDGRSMIYCMFYTINPETDGVQTDTIPSLTVTALGTDSIIVNRESNATYVSLPLSYVSDSTVLVFHYDYENDPSVADTLIVRQTNTPYFESLDCGYSMTQTVDDAVCTKVQMDSIYIRNINANTNGTENLKIFYRYTY